MCIRDRLDPDRAKELNIKSPDGIGTRLQKYASSLTKTAHTLDVLTNEFGAQMPKPITLPHHGRSIMNSKSGKPQ